jgi:hypothetical protein
MQLISAEYLSQPEIWELESQKLWDCGIIFRAGIVNPAILSDTYR